MKQNKDIYLERLRFHVARYINRSELNGCEADVDIMADVASDFLVARLTIAVAGEKPISKTFYYPKTWWDAVKDRFVPYRLRKGCLKPRYDVFDIETHTVYPKIQVPKAHTLHLKIATFNGEEIE